jgi:hypothetical protein
MIPVRRGKGRQFAKGKSGNPKGRPKGVGVTRPAKQTVRAELSKDVKELARATGPDDIQTLITIRDDKKAPYAVRAFCANSLLDRGFGRPPQSVDINANLTATVRQESVIDVIEGRLAGIRERIAEQRDPPQPN